MKYRVASIDAAQYPRLLITFDDGFSGAYDFSALIRENALFAPLKDTHLFSQVNIDQSGRRFGWALDDPGHEIDLCADATRIELETLSVNAMAREYAASLLAAE